VFSGVELQPINHHRQDDQTRCHETRNTNSQRSSFGVQITKADKGERPPWSRHSIGTLAQESRDDYGWFPVETM